MNIPELTLQQALARTLVGNPELTTFQWDLRAAEARTLQAATRSAKAWGVPLLLLFVGLCAGYVLATLSSRDGAGLMQDLGEDPDDQPAEAKQNAEHATEGLVRLTDEMKEQFRVKTATADVGALVNYIKLPGEVRLNEDRVARVMAQVPGVASQVEHTLGDSVHAGDLLAVIESRELADTVAAYRGAQERVVLAQTTFSREKGLWEKKISAEQDYLSAKQALSEANIELRTAEQKLRALGISTEYLRKMAGHADTSYTEYPITASMGGTIIEKHVVLGQSLGADAPVSVIADLSSVWVDFSVYQPDVQAIHTGQPVKISLSGESSDTQGTISYLGPLVGEDTRTSLARVVLANPEGTWHPGLFVTGLVQSGEEQAKVLIPKTAIQNPGGIPNVFIEADGSFHASPVTLGRSTETHIEVLSGLEAGQVYASEGTFVLKAELEKNQATED